MSTYQLRKGDRDCSSAVINAIQTAGINTNGASYTGNIRSCFEATGQWVAKPMSFTASPGDLYLNYQNHVAMCLSQTPDLLMEFSHDENWGYYGGRPGDQLNNQGANAESHVRSYYNYPWDCIMHYIGPKSKIDVAVKLMKHLVDCPEHGYTMSDPGRWGCGGYCSINIGPTSTHTFNLSEIKYGSQGNIVLLAEEILKAKGIYKGALDKSFGKQMTAAVKEYQTKQKIKVDGICGQGTWNKLLKNLEHSGLTYTVKQVSTTAKDIKESTILCQQILKARDFKGADNKKLVIDGSCGKNTQYAIKSYQKARAKQGASLKVDGVCGPQTWTDLLGM